MGSWDLPTVSECQLHHWAAADKVKAVYEGVALGIAHQVDKFRTAGEKLNRLMVTGGMARSTAWLKMLANATQLPIETVEDPHAALRGAAQCAAIGLGKTWPKPQEERQTLEPDETKAEFWQQRAERFKLELKKRTPS